MSTTSGYPTRTARGGYMVFVMRDCPIYRRMYEGYRWSKALAGGRALFHRPGYQADLGSITESELRLLDGNR